VPRVRTSLQGDEYMSGSIAAPEFGRRGFYAIAGNATAALRQVTTCCGTRRT